MKLFLGKENAQDEGNICFVFEHILGRSRKISLFRSFPLYRSINLELQL
jgi:hypothetical protein